MLQNTDTQILPSLKSCYRCGFEKPFTAEYFCKRYSKREPGKLRELCVECRKKISTQWRMDNPERFKATNESWRRSKEYKHYLNESRAHRAKWARSYREKNQEAVRLQNKRWSDKNRERRREYNRRGTAKHRATVKGKLINRMHSGLRRTLRDGQKGMRKWQLFVDFTLEELREHLEKRFLPGMTWGNMREWHIDHIRPVASFNITSPHCNDFIECWKLENLQPLWRFDNQSKSAKYQIIAAASKRPGVE